MSVERLDLNKCIGCRNCISVCPLDVFRFDETEMKSIIAYPDNCQNCGMCYMNCYGHSLSLGNNTFGFVVTGARAGTSVPKNHVVLTDKEGLDYLWTPPVVE